MNNVCVTPNKVDFSAKPTTGAAPLKVQFTDLTTGTVSAWDWNFGDGQPHSSDKNPSHIYVNTGVYDVTLTVTGAGGTNSITKKQLISVSGPCKPGIKANGIEGEITVTSVTPVSVTVNLTSGDKIGKSADWWFAIDSPWGWFFLTTSEITQIPIPLYQSTPLYDFPDVKILEGSLPVGEYDFIFAVYMNPNDTTDSPLYMDSIKVHVVN